MWIWVVLQMVISCRAEVVSLAVASVGDQIITKRQVEIGYVIEHALRNSPDLATERLKGEDYRKEIARSVSENVISLEAASFNVANFNPGEIPQATSRIRSYVAKHSKLWNLLEPAEREIEFILTTKLRAKKFIEIKDKSSFVAVTEAEAHDYFQKNRNKFGNLPFEKFRESIKSYLSYQQAEARLKEWFQILQRKYQVKHYASPDGV